MSTFEQINRVRPDFTSRVGEFIGGVSVRFAQYRTYRKTLDELEALSDRDLADLGISRLSLRSVAYRAAYEG